MGRSTPDPEGKALIRGPQPSSWRHSPLVEDAWQWNEFPELQFCHRSAVRSPLTSHCCGTDTAREQGPGRSSHPWRVPQRQPCPPRL